MKRFLLLAFMACFGLHGRAQTSSLTLDDNEFLIGKKVVAEVKLVKLGFFRKELRLLNAAKEELLAIQVNTAHEETPPVSVTYVNILIPAINDSIQMSTDTAIAEGIESPIYSDDDGWAAFFFKRKIVNDDGSLNIENAKALKSRYPGTVVDAYRKKKAEDEQCHKAVWKIHVRKTDVAAKVTEVSRETIGDKVIIEYQIEHDGDLLGKIKATGNVINLSNERAEIDFKTKIIYKKTDIEPMIFEVFNTSGCKLATYAPLSKSLMTLRTDKGGRHGIIKPILEGKIESIKARLEVIAGIADYLIKLGYY